MDFIMLEDLRRKDIQAYYLCRMKIFKNRQEVRFADIDAMGHVNNAVYLHYFEQARIHFFEKGIGLDWDWQNAGVILVKNELEYLVPIELSDRVEVETVCEHVGTKSITLSYKIYTENEERVLCTVGKSILVCFDHIKRHSIPVPDLWKVKLKGKKR